MFYKLLTTLHTAKFVKAIMLTLLLQNGSIQNHGTLRPGILRLPCLSMRCSSLTRVHTWLLGATPGRLPLSICMHILQLLENV